MKILIAILFCMGTAYADIDQLYDQLDQIYRIDSYTMWPTRFEEEFTKPFWYSLLVTDPPESGTSGWFAVKLSFDAIVQGEPILPYIQRELEAAAADIERRANAKKAKKVE